MAIDKKFEDLIKALIAAQGSVANGVMNGGQRRWMDFKEVKEAGQFDESALRELFSRATLNDKFGSMLTESGRQVKEFQVLKLANDFMAGMERDYETRRRSRIATIMHGMSRTKSSGDNAGPLRRTTVDYMVRLLDEDDKTQRAVPTTGS